ncbi:hypothetical protein P154DRAFT_580516 [Amniculicola lignicola CBS 123094]|uniref:Uncharacterized protein n=1 Tax=Amniculicola lignicola CBS 123094 TaxID=1392246 RepID=A0A6A5W1N1_9PLEO|nr:hypothetical protein P154DRAFT_580516 [Amniculicola lignicola CBS 123094]
MTKRERPVLVCRRPAARSAEPRRRLPSVSVPATPSSTHTLPARRRARTVLRSALRPTSGTSASAPPPPTLPPLQKSTHLDALPDAALLSTPNAPPSASSDSRRQQLPRAGFGGEITRSIPLDSVRPQQRLDTTTRACTRPSAAEQRPEPVAHDLQLTFDIREPNTRAPSRDSDAAAWRPLRGFEPFCRTTERRSRPAC